MTIPDRGQPIRVEVGMRAFIECSTNAISAGVGSKASIQFIAAGKSAFKSAWIGPLAWAP